MRGIYFTCYDLITGELTSVKGVSNSDEALANVPDGRGAVSGMWETETHFVDVDGTKSVLARPVVPVMDGPTYELSDLLEGAKLVVTDEEGFASEVLAQSDTLEIIEAGLYQVRSESPFPWIDFDIEVIVA
jgi:hypothetical protein